MDVGKNNCLERHSEASFLAVDLVMNSVQTRHFMSVENAHPRRRKDFSSCRLTSAMFFKVIKWTLFYFVDIRIYKTFLF